MHEDGLDLVPVVVDDETYRQAYDVVANTTLWYCHHHLFDLPHRPRFDRHWRAAWEGYRAYNRAMADVVVGAGRARATPCSCRTTTSRCSGGCWPRRGPTCARCTSCTRPSPRPTCSACCPTTCAAELLDGMAGYAACGFHCHQWEAGFAACYAAGRARPAPRDLRGPARPRRRRARGGGGVARVRGGGGGAAGRGGRAPHHRPDRPHGALEEHRAGDARLRGAAARVPRVARRGGARGVGLSQPAGAGRVSRLRGRRGAHGRADQPCLRVAPTAGRPSCSRSRTTGPARWPR